MANLLAEMPEDINEELVFLYIPECGDFGILFCVKFDYISYLVSGWFSLVNSSRRAAKAGMLSKGIKMTSLSCLN
jgi:hypothetical protein